MGDERKVGENFDENEANDIFDKLRNVEGKIKPKREGKFDNITNMMVEAQRLEKSGDFDGATKLYNEVIFNLPDSVKAYDALANIYRTQGDVDSERDILKKAIANCSKNSGFKDRLKEIN